MAVKAMRPGRSEVTVNASLTVNTEPRRLEDLPGGIFPLQTRSYAVDEYRLRNGWMVEVPRHDIRSKTMISVQGETFAVRDDSTAIQTGALIRWVPEPNLYDQTSLTWKPLVDNTGGRTVWNSSVEYMPNLIDDYEYRVGGERFVVNALNFDSDNRNHMWSDFSSTIGGGTGYTLIMVMSPNSVFGNDSEVPYNGIWCPGRPTPAGDSFVENIDDTWMSVTAQGGFLYLATESQPATRAIAITPEINSSSPMYLAIVFGRPETIFYAGMGPDSMRVQTVVTQDLESLMDNGVVLGRSTGDVLHTADMALLDLSVYADRLSAMQVHDEFSLLSTAYGGA